MDAATDREACDVCAGRTDLEGSSVTCTRHFLDWLDRDGAPPQRDIEHRQYGKERG
jgi:hypothetical protein